MANLANVHFDTHRKFETWATLNLWVNPEMFVHVC
jgi:hypothetical protein